MRVFAGILVLLAVGCGSDAHDADAGLDAGRCDRPGCAAPPDGCHDEGADGCTTCGTLVCDDAGTDAGMCAPPPCAAPPVGCRYEGADGCTTCGTLVCDEVVCGGASPRFPSFDRTCGMDVDCAVVSHQVDCCGSRAALGVAAREVVRFSEAERACASMFPACDCAAQPTTADDGTTGSGDARVACVAGQCTSTFAGGAAGDACDPSSAPCGPGLACCYPCGIPGCTFTCEPACDPSMPGCVGGCFLRP